MAVCSLFAFPLLSFVRKALEHEFYVLSVSRVFGTSFDLRCSRLVFIHFGCFVSWLLSGFGLESTKILSVFKPFRLPSTSRRVSGFSNFGLSQF